MEFPIIIAASVCLAVFLVFKGFNYKRAVAESESVMKYKNRGFKFDLKEIEKQKLLVQVLNTDFEVLTEAILDAATGNVERIRCLGIKAVIKGDKVYFSIGNNPPNGAYIYNDEEIVDAILNLSIWL